MAKGHNNFLLIYRGVGISGIPSSRINTYYYDGHAGTPHRDKIVLILIIFEYLDVAFRDSRNRRLTYQNVNP